MSNDQIVQRSEGYDRDTQPTAAILPLAERSEDRRAKLTRALAEIRQMDEDSAALKKIVDAQQQRIGELERMLEFMEGRCGDLDRDRMTYAKQLVMLSAQVSTIWHAAEQAVSIANAADALGIGGASKG